MTLFAYDRPPMEKQKLHRLAKFAMISMASALPLVGEGDLSAQQAPPAIVQAFDTAAAQSSQSFSYTSGAANPLAPTQVLSRAKIVPPIISGRALATQARTPAVNKAARISQNILSPIGSGIKQVAATTEPSRRLFSPAKIPVRTQGSGSRGFPAPAAQIPTPAVQIPTPAGAEFPRGSDTRAPAAPVISGSLVAPDTQQSVLGSGTRPGPPTFFDNAAPPADGVQFDSVIPDNGGCDTCGSDSCGGACGGGGNVNINQNQANCDYGTYGSVSAARRYAYLEFLFVTREDGNINNSNFQPLGDFTFSPAWRFTLGQRPDMTQGREFSYFGTSNIDEEQTVTNAANNLNPLFTPAGGFTPGNLTAFFNASEHFQIKETQLHSFEFNRVRWGWDVLKSFVGLRYIYFADDYELQSTSSFVPSPLGGLAAIPTEEGRFRIDTNNHLFGGHIGAELFYDIGYRFSLSGVSKFGAFLNLNKVDNFLENDGTLLLDTEDTDVNISTTWEINLLAHYQIRQTARLRLGYNFLFLGNVATSADNFLPVISPFTGTDTSDEDDAFIHGISFGLEMYR